MRRASRTILLAALAGLLAACGGGRRADLASLTDTATDSTRGFIVQGEAPWRLIRGQTLVIELAETGRWLAYLAADAGTAGPADTFIAAEDLAGLIAPVDARPFAVQRLPLGLARTGPDSLLLAINRLGVQDLSLAVHEGQAMVELGSLRSYADAFSSRTISQFLALPSSGAQEPERLLFLYRHPHFQPGEPDSLVLRVGGQDLSPWPGMDRLRDHAPGPEASVYAIFPAAGGSWQVQWRWLEDQQVRTAFGRWWPGDNRYDRLERSAFESALQPRPWTAADPRLSPMGERLEGDWLVELREDLEVPRVFLKGDAAAASLAYALIDDTGWLLLSSDGHMLLPSAQERLALPVPGARFTAVSRLGSMVVAIWEEDLFPDVGRSGLLLYWPVEPPTGL